MDWTGGERELKIAETVAACLSYTATVIVLFSYFFILWYRPPIVNRISLRLTVFSCFCTIIFLSFHFCTHFIVNTRIACRVIIYFLIVSDIMACMSLAMVGFNLVLVFIVRIRQPAKMEKYYYLIISLFGIFAAVVPLAVNAPADTTTDGISCWYHYYFYARIIGVFKWMWYYSCLLFIITFAAVCAALAIHRLLRHKDYFVGTLAMPRSRPHYATHRRSRTSQTTTAIVHKVILRCICYPLIPLVSKVWGVGIEVAAIEQSPIPYTIYVFDGWFSNLLGFMVSCIYFSDPSINTVVREEWMLLKRRYVDEYYKVGVRCTKVRPSSSPPPGRRSRSTSYARTRSFSFDDAFLSLRYTPNKSPPSNNTGGGSKNRVKIAPVVSVHGGNTVATASHDLPSSVRRASDPTPPHRHSRIFRSVHHSVKALLLPQQQLTLNATPCTNTPKIIVSDDDNDSNDRHWRPRRTPMHRRHDSVAVLQDTPSIDIWRIESGEFIGSRHTDGRHLDDVEAWPSHMASDGHLGLVEPYPHPYVATATHWVLTHLFRVHPCDSDVHDIELVELMSAQTSHPASTSTSASALLPQARASQPSSASSSRSTADADAAVTAHSGIRTKSRYHHLSSMNSRPNSQTYSDIRSLGSTSHEGSTSSASSSYCTSASITPPPTPHDSNEIKGLSRLRSTTAVENDAREPKVASPSPQTSSSRNPPQHGVVAVAEGLAVSRPSLLRKISDRSSKGLEAAAQVSIFRTNKGPAAPAPPSHPTHPLERRSPESTLLQPNTATVDLLPPQPYHPLRHRYAHVLHSRLRNQYLNPVWPDHRRSGGSSSAGVPLERPPSIILEDFLGTHQQESRSWASQAAAIKDAFELDQGFLEGVTKVTFILDWNIEDDDQSRIVNHQQSWSFDALSNDSMMDLLK